MNASSLHKSYCAATDVEPETPRSHFHSSLKSNLSSEEREASVFFFLMHRFAPYKETQFAIRVHLSKTRRQNETKRRIPIREEPHSGFRARVRLAVDCSPDARR